MEVEIQWGVVIAVTTDPLTKKQTLIVKNNKKETVYIKDDEIDIRNVIDLIGETVSYICIDKIEGKQYASMKKAGILALEQLEIAFEKDPTATYEAEVIQWKHGNVHLRMNHYIVHLIRNDITKDPIILSQLLSIGEKIQVRIKRICNRYIQVEAVETLNFEGIFTASELKENDFVYGVISNIKDIKKTTEDSQELVKHIFVNIGHQLDLLAPYNYNFEVVEGQPVIVKINQIDSDGKLRGKVLRSLKHEDKKTEISMPATRLPQLGDIRTGKVRLIRHDSQLGEKILILLSQGQQIIVPFSELSAEDLPNSELDWIGRRITVKIISVNQQLIGSKKQKDEEDRQQFISQWQVDPNHIKLAYLKEIGSIGYILSVENEEVFLLKSDYYLSSPTSEEPQLNDRFYVQLKSIQGSVIHVKMVPDQKNHELMKLGITAKMLQPNQYQSFPKKTGVITKIMKKGAYLNTNGIHTFLPNTLFSFGKTRIKDIHQLGDELDVHFSSYKKSHIIVAASPRFSQDEIGLKLNELEKDMLAYGVIRRIKHIENPELSTPSQVFTSIGFKLEALSSQSNYFQVEEGDRVIFKINQINEGPKIRGRIIRNLSKQIDISSKTKLDLTEQKCNE